MQPVTLINRFAGFLPGPTVSQVAGSRALFIADRTVGDEFGLLVIKPKRGQVVVVTELELWALSPSAARPGLYEKLGAHDLAGIFQVKVENDALGGLALEGQSLSPQREADPAVETWGLELGQPLAIGHRGLSFPFSIQKRGRVVATLIKKPRFVVAQLGLRYATFQVPLGEWRFWTRAAEEHQETT